MPVYRFLLTGDLTMEPFSSSLPDEQAAWREAASFGGRLLMDELMPSGGLKVTVLNEQDELIFSIEVNTAR